ncbi:MAG: hypothetical protein Q9187_002143 [Circinaria calcarea]
MQLSNRLFTTAAILGFTIAQINSPGHPRVTPVITPHSIPTPTISTAPSNSGYRACAIVSTLSAQFHSLHPYATTLPIVPIQDAYACLKSVPIFEKDALALIDGLEPYLQFQSTLAYLKKPPKAYPLPGVDLIDGLQQIRANVQSGNYGGEYAFQLDLWDLLNSAHDSHLSWVGDTLQSALTFVVPFQLVSVSNDGRALPSIYLLEDIRLRPGQTRLPYTPSPVKTINGQDVSSALAKLSLDNRLQDPDALYNTVFFEIAQIPVNRGQDGPTRYRFPGASTNFVFANGTNRLYLHEALVVGDFTNVNSGNAFYAKFCNGLVKKQNRPAQGSARILKVRRPPGYPAPVKIHSDYLVGGYFLNDTRFSDVAVLSVLGFSPSKVYGGQEFQLVLQEFLATAKAAGKTKLIVDVQANSGGVTSLGYETFLQLFPNIEPYGASVLRAHDGLNFIGQGISDRAQNISSTRPGDSEALSRVGASLSLNYASSVSVNGTAFSSWSEVYGPHQAYGDNFTSLTRFNLSYPPFALEQFPFINFTGRGNRVIDQTPPFAAENVILLTDGFCSSACAVFAEFMKTQAKVKSVTFGGRPNNKGSMQAVGGTKGTQVVSFASIFQFIGIAAGLDLSSSIQQVREYISEKLGATDLAKISTYPILRSTSAVLNFKSNIRMNDTTLTPLQFVYEAADCRLWYTPRMINDISEIWRAAAQAAWNSSSLCIGRSTNDPLSISDNNQTMDSDPSSAASPPFSGTAYPSSFGGSSRMGGWSATGLNFSSTFSGVTRITDSGSFITSAAVANITDSHLSSSSVGMMADSSPSITGPLSADITNGLSSSVGMMTDSGPSITSPPSAYATSGLGGMGQTTGFSQSAVSSAASSNPTTFNDSGNISNSSSSATLPLPAGITESQLNMDSVGQTSKPGSTMISSTVPVDGINNPSIIPNNGATTDSGSSATMSVPAISVDTPSITSDSGGTIVTGPSDTSSASPMNTVETIGNNGETNAIRPSITTSVPPANSIENPLPVSADGESTASGPRATTSISASPVGAPALTSNIGETNLPGPSIINSPPANFTGNSTTIDENGSSAAYGPSATSSTPFANPTDMMTGAGETAASGPSITSSAPPGNTTDNPAASNDSGAVVSSGPSATTSIATATTDPPAIMSDSGVVAPGPLMTNTAPPANITDNGPTTSDGGATIASEPSITSSALLANTIDTPLVASGSGTDMVIGPLATTPMPAGSTDNPSNLTDTEPTPTTGRSYTISAFASGTGYFVSITNSIKIPLSTGFPPATDTVNIPQSTNFPPATDTVNVPPATDTANVPPTTDIVNGDPSIPADSTPAFLTSPLITATGLPGTGGTGIGLPGITGTGTGSPGDISNFDPRADSNSSYAVGNPVPVATVASSEGKVTYRVEWAVGAIGVVAVLVGVWL